MKAHKKLYGSHDVFSLSSTREEVDTRMILRVHNDAKVTDLLWHNILTFHAVTLTDIGMSTISIVFCPNDNPKVQRLLGEEYLCSFLLKFGVKTPGRRLLGTASVVSRFYHAIISCTVV